MEVRLLLHYICTTVCKYVATLDSHTTPHHFAQSVEVQTENEMRKRTASVSSSSRLYDTLPSRSMTVNSKTYSNQDPKARHKVRITRSLQH